MKRIITAAAVAGVASIFVVMPAHAQGGQPTPAVQLPAMQANHTTEARKHCRNAVDMGRAGKADSLVQEAQQALVHVEAAQKETPTPSLQDAATSLTAAVDQAKAGKPDSAAKLVQLAMSKLPPAPK